MNASNPAVIDVTRHAAEELGFVGSGKAKVKLEVQK
jgi:rare lipoprotein A (peptidoglycan hydrolase)